MPSLHAVFLGLFAYSILGELAAGALALLASIAIFVAIIALLCFDRIVYVPTYRHLRSRFSLSALAAFSAAVVIEGAVAYSLTFVVRPRTISPGSAPMDTSQKTLHHRAPNVKR